MVKKEEWKKIMIKVLEEKINKMVRENCKVGGKNTDKGIRRKKNK